MASTRVAIVDSGGANIASIAHALDRLGAASTLTSDADTIQNASHVILPGVGAAASAMRKLDDAGLSNVIRALQCPVLGICLGMQLLASGSDEDAASCLGIIPIRVQKMRADPERPVPNIGWSKVRQSTDHDLFRGIADDSYFYFLHSFAIMKGDFTLATAEHDGPFTAVLAHRNFFAAQFHPERSAAVGSKFLGNFLEIAN